MRTFKVIAAQGELTIEMIKPLGRLPNGCTQLPPVNGQFIVGHSETGHHHVLDREGVADVGVMDKAPEGMRILYAIVKSPTPLVHLREFDTHEPIMLDEGEYKITVGREHDPYANLARMQAD